MRYDFTIQLVINSNFDFFKHVQNIQFGKRQPNFGRKGKVKTANS